MGFFDYLTCEAELPALGRPVGVLFQTKSVFRTSAELTITQGGRLIERRFRREECGTREIRPGFTLPDYRRIPLGERDLAFHGDVWFYGEADGKTLEYVARFTNGQLEWIRLHQELPELHRLLLDVGW